MRKHFHTAMWALGIFCLLVYFTNCDPTEESISNSSVVPSCIVENIGDCFTASKSHLELRVNSAMSLLVKSNQSSINIGGDCNAGGFAQNVVFWELTYNSQLRRRARDVGLEGRCLNGRFSLLVTFPKGLDDGTGGRAKHELDIEIWGIDAKGGSHQNTVLARKRVNLYPDMTN